MLKTIQREKNCYPRGFLKEINAICYLKNVSNLDPNCQKHSKIQNFESFMQFLSIFRTPWWLRMLKTFSKEQICCRGCFFEEIKQLVLKKCIKFRPKLTKTQKKIKI